MWAQWLTASGHTEGNRAGDLVLILSVVFKNFKLTLTMVCPSRIYFPFFHRIDSLLGTLCEIFLSCILIMSCSYLHSVMVAPQAKD